MSGQNERVWSMALVSGRNRPSSATKERVEELVVCCAISVREGGFERTWREKKRQREREREKREKEATKVTVLFLSFFLCRARLQRKGT